MKYYIHIDGSQQGPYSIEELEKIKIERTTMVWHEGMGDWKSAEDVSNLKKIFKATPPPLLNTDKTSTIQDEDTKGFRNYKIGCHGPPLIVPA